VSRANAFQFSGRSAAEEYIFMDSGGFK
jgi:hypothetical protein